MPTTEMLVRGILCVGFVSRHDFTGCRKTHHEGHGFSRAVNVLAIPG
jgi:hypothetical protein